MQEHASVLTGITCLWPLCVVEQVLPVIHTYMYMYIVLWRCTTMLTTFLLITAPLELIPTTRVCTCIRRFCCVCFLATHYYYSMMLYNAKFQDLDLNIALEGAVL